MMVEMLSDPMRALRRDAEPIVAAGRLDAQLQDLLDEGLILDNGGLYFARWLATRGRTSPYTDLTGLESWVNSFHLDHEYFDTAQPDWAVQCVGHGILLAQAVLTRAAELTHQPIDVLLTVDFGGGDFFPGSTFRFYGHRQHNLWVNDDIVRGDEPVAILRRAQPN
jgi:hypothetical protein